MEYNYIYETKSLIDNKIYIGCHQTNNLDDGYLGSGLMLLHAINKYGKENFRKTILEMCSSKEEMFKKESEIVSEEFVKRDDTFNLNIGGHGGSISGRKHSEETKEKICKILKLRAKSMPKEDFSHPGWKHSEETKKKIGDKHRGKKLSEETKEKLSKLNIGKQLSEETKKKISESGKGLKRSKKACENIRQSQLGKTLDEETKTKISRTLKGHKDSEETREKKKQAALKKYGRIREGV